MPAKYLNADHRRRQGVHHARRPRAVPDRTRRRPEGIGERIRKIGREYGTVTGRPRRCGWFDAVAVRYTAALAGADELAVMLLDVLSGLDGTEDLRGLRGRRRAAHALPERCVRAGALQAGVRDDCRAGPKTSPRRASWPTCRPRRGGTSTASRSWSGCRCRSSPSARIGSRRFG